MKCTEKIVSVNFGCEDPIESLSGYDLTMAPELSGVTLADTANENYITGANLAAKKLQEAVLHVTNDFIGVLAANRVMPDLNETEYHTGEFRPNVTIAPYNAERGVRLYKAKKYRSALRKMVITQIRAYPLVSKPGAQIKIYDNGTVATYTVDLVGGQENVIDVYYEVKGSFCSVLLDNDNLPVVSSFMKCKIGCNGTIPNDCGYTKSYNGTQETSGKEGYGLDVVFHCFCDYEALLCRLSKQYVGKIIWLKARLLLAEERKRNNRLNNWTVYNAGEVDELINELGILYVNEWNTFVNALPNILRNITDDCVECRRARWVQNI